MADAKPKLAQGNKTLRTCTGWTILFMVVLRIAIGWHFLYEGVWKIKSGTFSATPYLLASVGPMKDIFRGMVNDADGFKRMGVVRDDKGEIKEIKPDFQRAAIEDRVALITEFYGLDATQTKALKNLADRKMAELDELYGRLPKTASMPSDPNGGAPGIKVTSTDQSLLSQVKAYDQLLKQVKAEGKSLETKYLLERMEFNTTKVNGSRNAILARVEKPCKDVAPIAAPEIDRRARLTPEDLKYVRDNEGGVELTEAQLSKGPLPMPQAQHFPGKQLSQWFGLKFKATTRTEWQDFGMMFGLCAMGACLILGLFTRLSALGAATFLAMFYFSMPPWPGVPEVAPLEGHYLIVNKNLVELIACLMIMTSGVGRWFGLDAFIGAYVDRKRNKKAELAAAEASSGRNLAMDRPVIRETAKV